MVKEFNRKKKKAKETNAIIETTAKPIIKINQDTSTDIQRKQSTWNAIASITDSIANCVNVWNREKHITKRVKLELAAHLELAKKELRIVEIKADAFKSQLDHNKQDRDELIKQLNRMWKEAEIWDQKFHELDLEEMKKHQDFLTIYLEYKKNILEKITNMFHSYYQHNRSPKQIRE